jgi:hypothetical protein
MKKIELSKTGKNKGKYFAIVDDEDYDLINTYNWSIDIKQSYAMSKIQGKMVLMHRFIINTPFNKLTDHIDGDGLNNQKSNLRLATSQQNCGNRRPRGSSKYLGVSYKKSVKKSKLRWEASISTKYIGIYETEIEAAKAYDIAAKNYYGEYANLNFI